MVNADEKIINKLFSEINLFLNAQSLFLFQHIQIFDSGAQCNLSEIQNFNDLF